MIVPTTGLFGKHFKSRLDKLANVGDSFDLCRIYRHLVGNGQMASICARAPYPRRGK